MTETANKYYNPKKRGWLWYFLITLGLLVFAIVLFIASPDKVRKPYTLVSDYEKTYLVVETESHSEGFLDPYTSMAVYYTQLGGWFQSTKRELVFCEPHSNGSNIGFHRTVNSNGDVQIEVKRPNPTAALSDNTAAVADSQTVFSFPLPHYFNEVQKIPYCY